MCADVTGEDILGELCETSETHLIRNEGNTGKTVSLTVDIECEYKWKISEVL